MWSGDDLYFMRLAMEEAEDAERAGEVPIGAVLVLAGQVMGRGHNSPITAHDPSAHAEIQALRAAGGYLQNYRMAGATLYVTLEPCLMCAGAMVHARIGTLVFGAAEPRTGAVVSNLQALALAHHNHWVEVVAGVLESECRDLVQEFFRARR